MFTVIEPYIPPDLQILIVYIALILVSIFSFCAAFYLVVEIVEPNSSTYEYCARINQFSQIEWISSLLSGSLLMFFGFYYLAGAILPFSLYQAAIRRADSVNPSDIYRKEFRDKQIRIFIIKMALNMVVVLAMLANIALQVIILWNHESWDQILPFYSFVNLGYSNKSY